MFRVSNSGKQSGVQRWLIAMSFLLSVMAFSGYVDHPLSGPARPEQTELPEAKTAVARTLVFLRNRPRYYASNVRYRVAGSGTKAFQTLSRRYTAFCRRRIKLAERLFSALPSLAPGLQRNNPVPDAIDDPFSAELG